ncbi:hypothetical protein C5Y93_05060 [Blastopirellula marina]|uniref:Uncharacterized protein n=2 Tax=Blastopirellula marina TaxID=124 RepID=A0A2S8GSL0_9BACT|nr:hypothetical protein C5Y93_05060 [Blastopirellula marina]
MQRHVEEWQKDKDDISEKNILTLLEDEEYKSLDYAIRNKPFLTAHKLLDLEKCELHAKLRYVDLLPLPIEKENDNFTIGSGVENAITLSQEDFSDRYAVVKNRSTNEAKALAESGKELLTQGMYDTIHEARREFHSSPHAPKKLGTKNVIASYSGYVLKAEYDGFNEKTIIPQELKTCANINTFEKDFHPGNEWFEMYAFQQSFYSFVYELRNETHYDYVNLFVLDKYDWSRSHKFVLGYNTILRPRYDRVQRLIEKWKLCEESGMWSVPDLSTMEGRAIFRNSSYYILPMMDEYKKLISATTF